jgi:predicted HicB family RNase H-like nuclease
MIKSFPPELHKAAKIRAAEEEITLQELILRAVKEYLSKKKKG